MIGNQKLEQVNSDNNSGSTLLIEGKKLIMVDMFGISSQVQQETMIEYVENTDIEVYPSGAYWTHKRMSEGGTWAYRAGYHFMFWLLTKEDAKKFADGWEKNVIFEYEDLDKNVSVEYKEMK